MIQRWQQIGSELEQRNCGTWCLSADVAALEADRDQWRDQCRKFEQQARELREAHEELQLVPPQLRKEIAALHEEINRLHADLVEHQKCLGIMAGSDSAVTSDERVVKK